MALRDRKMAMPGAGLHAEFGVRGRKQGCTDCLKHKQSGGRWQGAKEKVEVR